MTENVDVEASGEPMTRVERKREQRIDQILRAASQILAQRGYHNTSLEMIAERLDLTKASLYHYYDSKDALFEACLARVAQRSIEQLALVADQSGSAHDRLRSLIIEHLTILTQVEPDMSRLFLQPFDWPESMTSDVRRWRALHSQSFERVIDEGVRNGEFKTKNDAIARHCMYGAINYVSVWFRPTFESKDAAVLGDVADEVLTLFAPAH